jgi:mono/diheme cytochrome c family protein
MSRNSGRTILWILLTIAAAGLACSVQAHDVITTTVTWNREILQIFKARCISCHQAGGSAFSLATYKEAFAWKTAIREEVFERRMPPWGAVKGFGDFRNDQALTPEQLEIISSWSQGGAPEGDPAPPAPPETEEGKKQSGWPLDEPHYQHPSDEMLISGDVMLVHPFALDGLWPDAVPDNVSYRIVAQFPDGRIEPLLWLMNYKRQFGHPFLLRKPLDLPAGTIVRGIPEGASIYLLPVSSSLLTAKPAGK